VEQVRLGELVVAPERLLGGRVAAELREVVHVPLQEPALVLVHDREERHELAVDVLRCPVGPGHAAAGDDDRPDQARVRVRDLVDVRVVHPED